MKAVLQRVAGASVAVNGEIVGQIGEGAGDYSENGKGLVVLLGVELGDTERDSTFLAQKIVELRIFPDELGKMNRSIMDVAGSILLISQFTLIADWRRGRRPGFSKAAPPQEGERLYLHCAEEIRRLGVPVQTGIFGANMQVSLINDGPVTLILENQFAANGKTSSSHSEAG